VTGGWAGVAVAVAIAAFIVVITYYGGDGLMLAASNAREVSPQDAPQLANVVNELSIAAGIPMPRIYLIDDTAPNAFATGRDPRHASVAITTGMLQKLDREELQGVMAHELAHVRNLDIRFALLVGALVGSIALLADFFLRFTFWGGMSGRSRGRDSGGGGAAAILFVIALVLAVLAPFFARLVQLAVSRQREYLADASSVEITRNPYGLQRALAKIAADREVLEVANRATQHLYIVNPIKKFEDRASGLASTHPPLLERINRLRELSGESPLDAGAAEALARLG
jgi:heat shock protein HtpX